MLGGNGVATVVMEILLEVCEFDMHRGAELILVNVDINIQESDMRRGDC